MHFLNKHIYAVHVMVSLCVFSNDAEKMPVKQITGRTVFHGSDENILLSSCAFVFRRTAVAQ